MEKNYQEVPNIITGKDLDYLSDMFEWNISAYKKFSNDINNIKSEEIQEMTKKAISLFQSNLEKILNILNQGGFNEQ